MIWGYDYSARLIVNVIILVVILSVHFLRLYIKNRQSNNEDNKNSSTCDAEKNDISVADINDVS